MGEADGATVLQSGGTRRFAAFISYSHADAAMAARLQRKLERYRLPRHVARDHAAGAQRLGKIFRDRADFAAASSLSAAIREALSKADALIVLCSPEAAASPWVAAEIALFRELHPDRPILSVLLSGTPATAFPRALTAGGNEPLAADLRPEGDGEQLAFLKIVAGIAGVPLDELVQRDAQRRLRRVTAVTGAALAAMLIMAVMTTLALQARNEAARQRAAAEGLVEYMLTDLRQKLKGVGRLEIMDAVNERAMTHYQAQGDLSRLPADSLERRARLLQSMGEDDDSSGNITGASAKFRQAHRTTQALLQREPDNPNRIFAHSQSEYWVGYAAYLREDWQSAGRHWNEYRQLASRLAGIDPANTDWLRELGYAEGNLCTLSLKAHTGREAALAICRSALDRMVKVMTYRPGDPKAILDVANRHAWLADAYRDAGDPKREVELRMTGKKLVDRLISIEPNNYDYRDMWVAAQTALARAELATGAASNARSRIKATRRQIAQMIAYDPLNENWRGYARHIEELADVKMGELQ